MMVEVWSDYPLLILNSAPIFHDFNFITFPKGMKFYGWQKRVRGGGRREKGGGRREEGGGNLSESIVILICI